MDNHTRIDATTYSLLPMDIEGVALLGELALDMRWSWNHAADELWRRLDPNLWDSTHNAWVVLQTVSRERISKALADSGFTARMNELVEDKRRASASPAWFQRDHADSPLSCVAYFSMEFMLSEALPIYSGGLGNVAGDQLKAASDLGVPVVGVGLLYQQGYFRQVIDRDGRQQEFYPYNDPVQLPVTPLRDAKGEWLRLEIALPGYSVWLRCWQVQVGRTRLYLLDSNDAANFPAHRGITSELYGGWHDLRIKQEMLLGIGGWRLLRTLGLDAEVCHLNEGHAAFAVLERARTFMEESGQPFDVALEVTRAGNLFTTHTAVPAGFDVFSPALVEQYLGAYARNKLGISSGDLLALGRRDRSDPSEPFNMAYLAIRGSGAVNGVSRLHGEVSRRLFAPLFPRWPIDEVPVGHVTNGIHTPSWDSAQADDLWTDACGKDRWLGAMERMDENFRRLPASRLWQVRSDARRSLIEYVRQRLSMQLAASGQSPEAVEAAKSLFDPDALTLGFARRFAAYKRPNLLLHDPERLLRLLTNPQRPVQLILAGKAHPGDPTGQAMIQQWMNFIRRPEARRHVTFLGDYDMLLTERLVQGIDVWLNTPRRPWEASGTSGMKVLVNGGLNLSELDGWWAEAYTPEVGWALGDGREHDDDPAWDAAEAESLYEILERQVVPEFYTRDTKGIPNAWVNKMRESMARLTREFSANRVVRQYTQQHYLPAAEHYRKRAADKGTLGRNIADWRKDFARKAQSVHFGQVRVSANSHSLRFEAEVYLNDMDAKAVCVELYADGRDGEPASRQEMTMASEPTGSGAHLYEASVSLGRPAQDFTARVVARHQDLSIPLEADWIVWQH
ncbi:MAG: alpha-glucan family phosphorylase [Planctomycetaceae bacterium]|nr:alpha-glucan family phosphorylase [Planctomycetaceae bacterium]